MARADVAPERPLVQTETFAPVAVLQVARDLDHAVALANGVPQGLVQAVHTRDAALRARLVDAAQAGIVQAAPGPLAIDPRALRRLESVGRRAAEARRLGRGVLRACAGAGRRMTAERPFTPAGGGSRTGGRHSRFAG